MSEGDHEVSKGVVCNPRRLGGKPCIAGRRIPAEMVVTYMDTDDREQMAQFLVEDYDLTFADIANAQGWDAKGRPGLVAA